MQIKTDFIESQTVGFRQIRLTFENGKQEKYFQEFAKVDGDPWFRLTDGVAAPHRLATFLDERKRFHQHRTAERIKSLERQALNG